MPIRIQCPHCATKLKLKDGARGKKVTCPCCGEPFVAKAPAPASDLQPIPVVPADESSSPTSRQPSRSICEACGRPAPTAYVSFHKHIGAVVLMFHRNMSGNFCRECIDKYFNEYTLTTLFLGWWGLISFFVTPFCLLLNVIRYAGAGGARSVNARGMPIDQNDPEVSEVAQRSRSRQKVLGPALCLILTAVIGLLFDGLAVCLNISNMNDPPPAKNAGQLQKAPVNPKAGNAGLPAPEETPEQTKERLTQMIYLLCGQAIVCLLILLAAVQMLRLKTYYFAMAGSILAATPVFATCCCISIPFGIWGIVVLCTADVRRGFM